MQVVAEVEQSHPIHQKEFVEELVDVCSVLEPTPHDGRTQELRRCLKGIQASYLPSTILYVPVGHARHRIVGEGGCICSFSVCVCACAGRAAWWCCFIVHYSVRPCLPRVLTRANICANIFTVLRVCWASAPHVQASTLRNRLRSQPVSACRIWCVWR